MLEVFNGKVKRMQKERAGMDVEESRKVDYLRDEVAMRLCERLLVFELFFFFFFFFKLNHHQRLCPNA